MEETTTLELRVNGERRVVAFPSHHTLLEVLREECALTGTKHGCELGECGTCTVLLDGKPVLSCLVLAAELAGREIETVEGLQQGNRLHPLQAAFADLGAAQCGYCTPGILMAAKALLAENARPSESEIREALSGNLCRCTGYHKILQAVEWAAARERNEAWEPPPEVLYGSPATAGDPHSSSARTSTRALETPEPAALRPRQAPRRSSSTPAEPSVGRALAAPEVGRRPTRRSAATGPDLRATAAFRDDER
ncbi:MAG: (2Fe-2S)-binding protein [Thermoanaerobaculia bacterium]